MSAIGRQFDEELERELARCDRELAAMRTQEPTQKAYLTTLGMFDYETERRILLDPKYGEQIARRLAQRTGGAQ